MSGTIPEGMTSYLLIILNVYAYYLWDSSDSASSAKLRIGLADLFPGEHGFDKTLLMYATRYEHAGYMQEDKQQHKV